MSFSHEERCLKITHANYGCILWFDLYRPRMAAERGNLVFLAGSAQNIEFRTGSLGKIKLNGEDLGECLHQVIQWKYI